MATLEMIEQGQGEVGLEAAYVIVAEGYNSTHAASAQITTKGVSPAVPTTAKAATAAAATADPNAGKFSIMCSFLRHATPLAVGEAAEGFLEADEEHLYVLHVLDVTQDITLALLSEV